MRLLYSELSSLIRARKNCAANPSAISANGTRIAGWFDKHTETIESLVKQHLPSGSGFDNGTKIDFDASHADKLVFYTSFHHMNDGGFYDGWTEHTVTVTPALADAFHLRISGRDRNDIKDYIHEAFYFALRADTERLPDSFADVPDFTRCAGCRGRASGSVAGKRYCVGCGKRYVVAGLEQWFHADKEVSNG